MNIKDKRKIDRKIFSKIFCKKDEGFTIIGVLILIGLVTFVSSLVLNMDSKTRKVEAKLSSKKSTEQFQKALEMAIVRTFKASITPTSCQNPAHMFANKKVTRFSSMHFSNSIPKINLSSNYKTTGMFSDYEAGRSRCRSPSYPTNINQGGRFYFCLRIATNDPSAQFNDLVNAQGLYAEVLAEMKHSHEGTLVTCKDYGEHQDNHVELVLYYSLYWANKIGSDLHYSRLNSTVRPLYSMTKVDEWETPDNADDPHKVIYPTNDPVKPKPRCAIGTHGKGRGYLLHLLFLTPIFTIFFCTRKRVA